MARVVDALFDVMSGRFEWGRCDCCTAASDVFLRLHGVDPMAPLRGTYHNRRGAVRHAARYGGFAEMCAALADRAGLRPGIGQAGEIGLYDFGPCRRGLCVSVAPGVWQGKAPVGFAPVASIVRAWRV